jgi:hypothetical protein
MVIVAGRSTRSLECMRSDVTAMNRTVGGLYVVAAALVAVMAGPIVLFVLSEGRVARVRELFTVVGPVHVWIVAVLIIAAVAGFAVGARRVVEIGSHLVALEPGHPWRTLVPWAMLITVAIATTALYGQHAL